MRSTHRHRNRNREPAEPDDEYDRRSYRNRKRPTAGQDKRGGYYEDDSRPSAPAAVDPIDERRPHSDGRKSVEPVQGKRKKGNYDRLGHNTDEKVPHDDRRQMEEDRRVRGGGSAHEKRRPNSERRPAIAAVQYDSEYDYDDYSNKKIREDDYDESRVYGKRPGKPSQPEIVPKVRSSSSTASIYNRPRSPPKISRPVPNNEKKKYEYAPQKAAKAPTTAAPANEDFYDDYDYESEKQQPDIKHFETGDSKKSSYPSAPSSQRDHRPSLPTTTTPLPAALPPSRGEFKLSSGPGYADELEGEENFHYFYPFNLHTKSVQKLQKKKIECIIPTDKM